jgi:MFS family permease
MWPAKGIGMEDGPGKPRPSSPALAPLRYPVFRAVWLASLASNFGGLIQSVGAAWLMTSIAPQASMVALVQASAALPIMLLSLLSGAVADNFDRRRIMLLAQAFMLVVSALLTVVTWAGLVTPWLLLLFTFLIGCGTAMNGPAWQASVGDMVPRSDLPAAVGLNSMGFNIARSVGPALGGLIVAVAGAAVAFAINAMSYVGLILVLARWSPEPKAGHLPPEPLGPAMLAGPRYVALSPAVRVVLLRAFVFGLGASAVNALMPLIARELVGGGPLTYGLLLGAFGIGAVGGALVSTRVRARLSTEALVRGSSLGFAAGAAVAGLSGALLVTLPALLVAGAGWVLALSSFNVTVQMSTPRWVVARALSLYQMAAFGGLAGGSWLWGMVAEEAGIRIALLSAAGVLIVCTLIGLVRPLADTAGHDLGPLRSWSAPETRVPVDGRTGPVVIAVEWHVNEADLPEFLGVMAERRRIRRRDGAHNWMLLRDLADPSLWVERYHAPTWHDYLRLNTRLTQDDAAVFEGLRRLHQGDWPPKVRRMVEREARPWAGDAGRAARELATPLTDPTRIT